MDLVDPDPAICVINLQDAKKLIFLKSQTVEIKVFFAILG
jgi:hypothetical protein